MAKIVEGGKKIEDVNMELMEKEEIVVKQCEGPSQFVQIEKATKEAETKVEKMIQKMKNHKLPISDSLNRNLLDKNALDTLMNNYLREEEFRQFKEREEFYNRGAPQGQESNSRESEADKKTKIWNERFNKPEDPVQKEQDKFKPHRRAENAVDPFSFFEEEQKKKADIGYYCAKTKVKE